MNARMFLRDTFLFHSGPLALSIGFRIRHLQMHKLASPLRPDDDLLVVICNLSTDEGSSSNHLESTLKDVESTEIIDILFWSN